MKMRLRYKAIALLLLFLYPLMDMIYNTFSEKLHYSTFSISYFLIYIVLTLVGERYLRTKRLLVIGIFTIFYGLLGYSKSGSVLFQFFMFLMLLGFFSNQKYLDKINSYRKTHKKVIRWIIVVYALFLVYSILFNNGIQAGWNTFALYGPYLLPHTLAYEMLVLLTICLLDYKESKKKKWLMIAGFFELMIILTCVRSAVLSSLIIIIAFTLWFDFTKKLYFLIFGGILAGVFAYYGVFDQIIEKTLTAISNGSITNGREWIVESTLQIFGESSFLEKIFGSGYFNLLAGNQRLLGTAIQGHNDLLTVLISFGIVGVLLYIIGFVSYVKGKGWLCCFACLFVLLFFNGLYLYMPMVIGMGIMKIFFATGDKTLFGHKKRGIMRNKVNANEQLQA